MNENKQFLSVSPKTEMSELESESESWMLLLDLLASAGYVRALDSGFTVTDRVAGGLAWCIAATKAVGSEFNVLADQYFPFQDKTKVGEVIEASLKLMRCPFTFEAHQLQDLDYERISPVVQWITNRVVAMQAKNRDEKHDIEEDEHAVKELEKELTDARNSIKLLQARLDEQDIERQISDYQSCCEKKCSELQADVNKLEKSLNSDISNNCSDNLDHFNDSFEKQNAAKMELAAKLREIVFLKRRLGDVPSQTELVQYERRFSELYVQIQEKLRRTRKYYGTFNALLEIKELMLKETSLLNSISSQFQDAITSTAGRTKLVDSMEGIAKGTRQKLEKVQLGLQAEQKVHEGLKERYAAAMAEQRRCSSLLKAFQEECTKNEKLRSQISI